MAGRFKVARGYGKWIPFQLPCLWDHNVIAVSVNKTPAVRDKKVSQNCHLHISCFWGLVAAFISTCKLWICSIFTVWKPDSLPVPLLASFLLLTSTQLEQSISGFHLQHVCLLMETAVGSIRASETSAFIIRSNTNYVSIPLCQILSECHITHQWPPWTQRFNAFYRVSPTSVAGWFIL